MKTQDYNPSPLEKTFAESILSLQDAIQHQLTSLKITGVRSNLEADNPLIHFDLEDEDGDRHEIVLKVIQRIDDPSEA